MPDLNYKNINVHYSVQGEGDVVVLLHGLIENMNMWNGIAPTLSKNKKIISIDLLGHGLSGSLGYVHTMEENAKLVKYVLDHLRIKEIILIGHSMGGYVSLAFAELYPQWVRALCLMNSSALPDSEEKKAIRDRAVIAAKHNSEMFIRLAVPNLFSEENRSKLDFQIKQVTKEALQTTTQGVIASLEGIKIRKDRTFLLNSTNFPMLMIIGKNDPALDYQTLIEQTVNTEVQVVEFPDGHMSHFENKKELLENLIQFIN